MPSPLPSKAVHPDRVVFLDRDGVINHDSPDYIKSPDEFNFLPRSLDALKILADGGWTVIVITNQSAVGRGLITVAGLKQIHARMKKQVTENGGHITDIFYCPHLPEDGCVCRKPNPALIRQAAEKYGIDLSRAVMIGDRITDIQCGCRAGCGRTILVCRGAGPPGKTDPRPSHIADDLYAAVQWIVTRRRKDGWQQTAPAGGCYPF